MYHFKKALARVLTHVYLFLSVQQHYCVPLMSGTVQKYRAYNSEPE